MSVRDKLITLTLIFSMILILLNSHFSVDDDDDDDDVGVVLTAVSSAP